MRCGKEPLDSSMFYGDNDGTVTRILTATHSECPQREVLFGRMKRAGADFSFVMNERAKNIRRKHTGGELLSHPWNGTRHAMKCSAEKETSHATRTEKNVDITCATYSLSHTPLTGLT